MRRLAVVLALALLAAGCGGGPNAQDVLRQTASNLGQIRSGILTVHFLVTPQGDARPFGFDLHGPFAFRGEGLPHARLVYTRIANGNRAAATFVSDGSHAYAEANGARRPLTPAAERTIRGAGAQLSAVGAIARVVVGDWLEHARVSRSGDTERVTARLDVAQAVPGLLAALRLSGRNLQQPGAADAKRLRDAFRSTRLVLYSGRQDHLLRELDVNADLGPDVPASLRPALGSLAGARVDFSLKVAHPNGRVRVAG